MPVAATGPVYDQGGAPRLALRGGLAVRADNGAIEWWNPGTLAWDPVAAPGGGSSGPPTGSIVPFAGLAAAVPAGYLLCDGSAVSRTTYAALFAVTSTLFGIGDGLTTFNLPDFRSRFIEGALNDGAVASVGGALSPAVTDPGHTHPIVANGARGPGAGVPTFNPPGATGPTTTGITIPDGRPPFLTTHWMIKT